MTNEMCEKSARWYNWTICYDDPQRAIQLHARDSLCILPRLLSHYESFLLPLSSPVALFLSRRARNAFSRRIFGWRSQAASSAETSPGIFLTDSY